MDKLNKYGFVSGGYIFDLLDRAALEAINERFNNADKLIFTVDAQVEYHKQLCNLRGAQTIVDFVEYDKVSRRYVAGVRLRQIATDIAHGTFYFKKANHNYCEIKDEK